MNIILAGVGGQGLVLTTDLICEVALEAGYDVKSNDVVGLSQRGGKVWGSVKFDKKVHSPNILKGDADLLLALEPLEGLRWQDYLKKGGKVMVNTAEVYPVFAIAEKMPYPHDFLERFRSDLVVEAHDVLAESIQIGTPKIVNVVMLGMLAKNLDIPVTIWKKVIQAKVPAKFLGQNIKGFDRGYQGF
ncbi:indolepyruvate oxidoreductase subunit beta [Fusibacter tunisiensis]|uniref:Indolepyruvate ferredoxin oxidoreductase beta subunit n=1 Tax=Fusibacter tunisiensis TaxID=1008308 RepID=A0ABS2MRL1_9FIRM|nr:indolepyruvate oxidoreductase subunit beta [Fusibacter tunisiensis]MBM7562063.1 indolepyruvate ferredoxin oxidoreductase beta subunit [Fusibacter tunisiensis]